MSKLQLTNGDLFAAEAGKVLSDGDGVTLRKTAKNVGAWYLRYTFNGKAKTFGLGGWPAVGRMQAREKAAAARRLIASGIDPVAERKRSREAAPAAPTKTRTF